MVFVVLSVGRDFGLLKARRAALREAGFVVNSASTRSEALEKLTQGDFDLVLLCQSLGEDTGRLAKAISRLSPSTPLVAVAESQHPTDGCGTHIVGNDPDEIVKKITDILAEEPAKRRVTPESTLVRPGSSRSQTAAAKNAS
jgi:CheY-like chemotaxis protein